MTTETQYDQRHNQHRVVFENWRVSKDQEIFLMEKLTHTLSQKEAQLKCLVHDKMATLAWSCHLFRCQSCQAEDKTGKGWVFLTR